MDILLNNDFPLMRFYAEVKNSHMEGTVSQILYSLLIFYLFEKTGNFL